MPSTKYLYLKGGKKEAKGHRARPDYAKPHQSQAHASEHRPGVSHGVFVIVGLLFKMLDIKACLSARRWQVDSLATLCELMLFSQRATLLNRAYEPGVVGTCLYACSTSTLESEIMSSQLDMPLLLKERRGEEGNKKE